MELPTIEYFLETAAYVKLDTTKMVSLSVLPVHILVWRVIQADVWLATLHHTELKVEHLVYAHKVIIIVVLISYVLLAIVLVWLVQVIQLLAVRAVMQLLNSEQLTVPHVSAWQVIMNQEEVQQHALNVVINVQHVQLTQLVLHALEH